MPEGVQTAVWHQIKTLNRSHGCQEAAISTQQGLGAGNNRQRPRRPRRESSVALRMASALKVQLVQIAEHCNPHANKLSEVPAQNSHLDGVTLATGGLPSPTQGAGYDDDLDSPRQSGAGHGI